jgi:hypothetical protein
LQWRSDVLEFRRREDRWREWKGVKIRGRRMEEMEGGEPHAIGKLFSEKQAYAEAIANALGPI